MVEGTHQTFQVNFVSKGLSLSGNQLLMIPEVNGAKIILPTVL